MSKPVVFPYGITLKEGGVIETFPAVEVSIRTGKSERLSLFLLLDSGAALSALPRSDAAYLGIDPSRGFPMHIVGVSGAPIRGWRHHLSVRLAGEELVLPVVFLDDTEAPRVLGRAGVFDKFIIIFEERKNRSAFVHAGSRTAQSLQELLDAW